MKRLLFSTVAGTFLLLPMGAALAPPVVSAPTVREGAQRLQRFLDQATRDISRGHMDTAYDAIQQVLERDHNSRAGWQLLAKWAVKQNDKDLQLWALYRDWRLAEAQGLSKAQSKTRIAELQTLDPTGGGLFELTSQFSDKLLDLAKKYEKQGRPHGAIRVYKRMLALDPQNKVAEEAVERIASAPDPSLAPHATPVDLFEGVDQAFIDEFDAAHNTWDTAAREEREHYITITDTGYKNLIRTAEAMEQVNTFYREFFGYGGADDSRSVPRITVHLFKDKDEYLERGFNPVEWSGGHFTGSHVETFLPGTGFEGVVGTLFHEAAHQFVSLATSATGWLNEGLASFFEGTKIQANGTVVMNLPAGHRLFPLAKRMDKGWMDSWDDGIDPADPSKTPDKAPTFRIIVANEYSWGPPWYAPTWGLVYFLYNFQDPWDGRFVYRTAFKEFINSSGGRVGKGAVKNFEEVVLQNPMKAITKEKPENFEPVKLPTNVDELDAVWKDWILALRDREAGKLEDPLPYLRWARFASEAGLGWEAKELYEKALLENPNDLEALDGLAEVLVEEFDEKDRASILMERMLRVMEADPDADPIQIAQLERRIKKLDPSRRNLTRIEDELLQQAEIELLAYREANHPRMVLEWARRLGRDFGEKRFYEMYREVVIEWGGSVDLWDRIYNEEDLDGWLYGTGSFTAEGAHLRGKFGEVDQADYSFRFLTLDRLTSGDYSLEAELEVRRGQGAFGGFVFGQKGTNDFHGMALFPGVKKEGAADTGYLDLFSSFGGTIKTWRHVPKVVEPPAGHSVAGVWHRIRLDVTGREVDVWVDGERLTTHKFSSRSVLTGSVGLMIGPGKASFRNVRFIGRDPRDPAGRVDREARLKNMGVGSGDPVGGSYQNLVPPFPAVDPWVQGQRESWQEAGPVPQLLVLFSLQQNDLMPLHDWLSYLSEQGEEYGLKIVSVAQCWDKSKLRFYMDSHAFPGAVGADKPPLEEGGLGEAFDQFFISRFNLPRLILIDPSGKVSWEGDPGFKVGMTPEEPYPSFLDDPLQAMVNDFHLVERRQWREAWLAIHRHALLEGNLEAVLPVLHEAKDFGEAYSTETGRAQGVLKRLSSLASKPDAAIAFLEVEQGHAAAPALKAWFALTKTQLDRPQAKALGKLLGNKKNKMFIKQARRMVGYLKKGKDLDSKLTGWIDGMESLGAPFMSKRLQAIREAREAGDQEALLGELQSVESWPAAWAVETLLWP
ncbi:MAG: hypothetical protein GY930_09270 [bacterium]|nr:hypothetical protein [bacterium]